MARFALLALALVASASASFVPAVRQPVVPNDVIGTFRRTSIPFGADECPSSISHSATVAEGETTLSHDVMTINNNACEDGGEMTLFNDAESLMNEIDSDQTKSFLQSYIDTDAQFIFGLEKEGRNCGGGVKVVLKPQTVVLIFNPEEAVFPGGINFPPGRVYMIVIEPDTPGGICTYVRRKEQASKKPTPKPSSDAPGSGPTDPVDESPEPEASESPEPATGGTETGTGTGTGTGGTGPDTSDAGTDEPLETPGAGGAFPGSGTGTDGSEDGATVEPSASVEDDDGDDDDDDDDDSVCFPADATVELENGSFKSMAQVELGDRVKVADGSFSDVFMFTHKDASAVHDFVRISTRSGASLSATRGHYIYINNAFAAAGSAKVGDTLELGDGSKTLVSNVAVVKGTGLFNPQTVHGDIIVNSVRASTFTRTIEPSTAQAMLAPLRMLYDTFGISAAFLNNGADTIASILPKGQVAL